MCTTYPTTKEEMLKISGVGEFKYNNYGELFINAIKDYLEKNPLKTENSKTL